MFQPLIRTLRKGRRYRRNALIVTGMAIAVLLVFQVVAPFLISTALVRTSIEEAVEKWFGHDATIGDDPELHFWPHPHIILKDITIRETEAPSSRVIAHVDRLSASFKLYQAVLGTPVFEDFDVVRPKIFAIRHASGNIDWSMDGRLNDAVHAVRTSGGDTGAIAENIDSVIGEVTIEDGTIEITDEKNAGKTAITGLNGTMEWPRLSAALALRIGGTVKNETFALQLASAQPLVLLAGRDADAELGITSNLFSGQFNGTANLASYALLSGSLNIDIPRMPQALDWAGINVSGMDRLQQLSLNARLTTAGNALRLEQVSLQANEAKATGIMDLVGENGKRPRLTGTLAFDRLNFSAILEALSPHPRQQADEDVTPAALLGDMLDLDLRLSASEAQLGPLPLQNAAVSVMNTLQLARIDLVDSSIDGGRLTGQISAVDGKINDGGDLKLALRDVDLASVARRLGAQTLLPEANGSAELSLHLPRPLGIVSIQDVTGTLRMSARNGRISGLDLNALRQLSDRSSYLPLKDVADGSIAFDRMDITANIADGIAEVGEARLDGPDDLVTLSGLVPLETQGLALSANIYSKAAGMTSNTPLMVFIGGAWPTPIFWPMTAQP